MQDTKIFEIPSIQAFRRRLREEGAVFRLKEQALVIFDPKIAERVEAENYADLTMLDGFSDVVRGRESEAVSWHQVRGAWLSQMLALAHSQGMDWLYLGLPQDDPYLRVARRFRHRLYRSRIYRVRYQGQPASLSLATPYLELAWL